MIELLELPELVILLILDHLSYEDLQNLRVTCKKLKETIDRRTHRNLHLFVNDYLEERELLHTGELVRYANTFQVSDLNILKSTKFKSLFIGLRRLTIHKHWNGSDKTVNLDDLNCFQGLVHLELDGVAVESGKMSLRNLKIALLETENDETTNFELDSPQLQVLGLGYNDFPKLTQETGDSVRYLYLNDGTNSETSLFLLYAKLRGLFTICFNISDGLNSFVVALMERRVTLPSLKQIQLKGECLFPERGVVLKNLAKLKSRQETKHLEVRIHEKVMESDELTELLDLLHQIFPPTPDNPEHQMNRYNQGLNFGLLESDLLRHFNENPILHCLLPSVYGLDLRLDEDVRLSKQLIGRLTNLESLIIDIALDEQYFESILKSCKRISGLQILPCSQFKQRQLDQMPDYLQNLSWLMFGSEFGRRNFDLHFLTKFKHLSYVSFDCNIPKETMSFLFKNCNHPDFQIELHGFETILIRHRRNENGWFEIRCYNPYGRDPPKIAEFDSIEEMIDLYYRFYVFLFFWDPWRSAFNEWRNAFNQWITAYNFQFTLI